MMYVAGMAALCISWIIIHTILLYMTVQAGVYIPKRNYTFYLPNSLTSDDIIGIIPVSQNKVIKCDNSSVDIVTSSINDTISVELEDDHIIIRALTNFSTLADTSVFEVSLTCANESFSLIGYYQPLMSTKVILNIDPILSTEGQTLWVTWDDSTKKAVASALCPENKDLVYDIIENSESDVIDIFGKFRIPADVDVRNVSLPGSRDRLLHLALSLVVLACFTLDLDVTSRESEVEELRELVFLNITSMEITLLKSLDREERELLILGLLCSVTMNGQLVVNETRIVTINVMDVNDNPPSVEFKRVVQMKTHDANNINIALKTFDLDKIFTNANSYRVTTNDTKGVIILKPSTFKNLKKLTLIDTAVVIVLKKMETPYSVDVTLEDLTYEPNDKEENKDLSNKAVHRIVIPGNLDLSLSPKEVQTTTIRTSLDISSAKYSLVTNLGAQTSKNIRYETRGLLNPNVIYMIAVTDSGKVYVNDTYPLSRYTKKELVYINVIKLESGVMTRQFDVFIMVSNNYQTDPPDNCDIGCSIHISKENCTKSCGYGAVTGRCKWLNMEADLFDGNSTCTPSLDTCPDGWCSDLEILDLENCPQDCNNESIHNQLARQSNNPDEDGPCHCDSKPTDEVTDCKCEDQIEIKLNSSRPAGRISHPEKARDDKFVNIENDSETCNSSCRAAITGSLPAVVVAILLVLVGWMIWRRRRRHHVVSLKHVNSLVSMTAVPSDYIVDDTRDMRSHGNRQTSSPASIHWSMKLGFGQDMIVDKWEFPRRHLTLEHVIGEGEFGQVVRAQAFQLRGQDGNTVVAVKMLKPDASGAEYQDLVSEFQLLKEVSHPNVIQLLGVCTQKGLLYVIVEYCELGSLRNFLRGSKFKNKMSWEEKMKMGNDSQTGTDNGEVRILTCRDFFSFAWQIAKGMDYLAGLKIVHRDLAARNVLVTNGLKMKISDFGLSRDVYEADTYLKMSKGRIPVKWMAPESLYGQIYTTKSDIWSYGIVLWEIITLGASPYPGIPPERLFPLLSTGYRMDRPDECPDELYAIMQKCWKLEPEDRPHFSVLRDILDHLLQQNTEYLDLSDDYFLLNGTGTGFHVPMCYNNSINKQEDQCPTTHPSTKPHYSNVSNPNHCPPNVYVTTQWENDDLDSEECPELHTLLDNKEISETEIPSNKPCYIVTDEDDSRDERIKTDHILVHENLTYI